MNHDTLSTMGNWFRRLILGIMLIAATSTGTATQIHTFVANNDHSDRPTASFELGATSSSHDIADSQPTEHGQQPSNNCHDGGSGCHTLFGGPSYEMTHYVSIAKPIDFYRESTFSAIVGASFRPPIKSA